MNRIVGHHSAGPFSVTVADREHYHRIIDGDGKRHSGRHPISANAPGKPLRSGSYAAHTRGLNTGSIGVAMACMHDAKWSSPRSCAFFPKAAQVSAFISEMADLAIEYSIPVTRKTVLTHAEVEITLGVEQAGKWDFDYDPWGRIDSRDPVVIGDLIRDAVSAEIARLGGKPAPAAASPRKTLRRGHTGPEVRELQTLLNAALKLDKPIAVDGQFGPGTFGAVQLFQIESELLPDGIAGRMTWTALLEAAA
ncbi:peptidoglycan recognition protein family protein [Paracoccus haematequi]|nr:peptidoglycan-binding domain-containing protein [Paracoccus haematequi]